VAKAPKPAPKPEPARPAAVARARVSIQVWTSGGQGLAAEVRIDGKLQSKSSPLTIDLEVGPHEIEVRPADYPAKKKKIQVEPGKDATVRFMAD
jgi:hypothetical protein